MNRYRFLGALHAQLEPRTYLEIGINDGRSLALARARTIGVDPAFKVVVELACALQLVKATSDDFFARPDPLAWFPERTCDLTYIDGMHLVEFALRDFINVERRSTPAGVVVFDDALPRAVEEAARVRRTLGWTGDVYKMSSILERYRPDLTVVAVNTKPTGQLLVTGLDPGNTTLSDRYDEIVAEQVHPDPQAVPVDLMQRRHAADPDAVFGSAVWDELKTARDRGGAPSREALDDLVGRRGTAHYNLVPRTYQPWPPPQPSRLRSIAGRIRRAIR